MASCRRGCHHRRAARESDVRLTYRSCPTVVPGACWGVYRICVTFPPDLSGQAVGSADVLTVTLWVPLQPLCSPQLDALSCLSYSWWQGAACRAGRTGHRPRLRDTCKVMVVGKQRCYSSIGSADELAKGLISSGSGLSHVSGVIFWMPQCQWSSSPFEEGCCCQLCAGRAAHVQFCVVRHGVEVWEETRRCCAASSSIAGMHVVARERK